MLSEKIKFPLMNIFSVAFFIGITILISALFVSPFSVAGIPEVNQAGDPLECDDSGYVSIGCGFSLMLPDDLKACHGWHRTFMIPLGKRSEDRYVTCGASYNGTCRTNLEEWVNEIVSSRLKDSDYTLSGKSNYKLIERFKTKLAELKAERYVLSYYDQETGTKMILDCIDAFSTNFLDENSCPVYMYSIDLTTTAERYKQDRETFEEIIQSWKTEPAKGL